MSANKYRIGNWIRSKQWRGYGRIDGIELTDNGFELKVKGYVHTYSKGYYFDLEDIPLTEELLIIMGFNEEFKNTFFYRESPLIFVVHRSSIPTQFMIRFYNYTLIVESVHELQNVFYALGKRELDFNLYNTP